MSHSDSELKDDIKKKLGIHQLHCKLKAKDRIVTSAYIRKLKQRLDHEYLELRLVQAVNTNNVDQVKTLLESGVSANSTDTDMRCALHVAASKGYADIVRLLLSHGADPNRRDVIQNTPMHLAACIHNLPIISMLIEAKADVRCLDIHGRSPLQLVSSKLQILQKSWREGAIELIKLRTELQQVIDLLLSCLTKSVEDRMEEMSVTQSNVDDLQLLKLSLNSDSVENLDDQMSKLLNDIEQFKIK